MISFFEKNNYLIVALLLCVFLLLSITSMREKSATFDEPVHLAAGYSYIKKGDYRLNIEHPPLMKLLNAFPLLFLKLSAPFSEISWRERRQWLFGEDFVFKNKVSADKLLFLARLSTVLVAVLLGLFIFRWTKKLYGIYPAFFSLFLFVFCPNIIANAQLVTTDLAASCFIFLSVYSFWRFLGQPIKKNIFLSGVSLGLALASKFTTVIIFPIYLGMYVIHTRQNKKIKYLKLFVGFVVIGVIAFVVLLATYQFSGLENYFTGLERIIAESREKGHESFLLGRYSNTGWRYYYFVVFLLKTPLPLIFLIFLWIYLAFSKKILIKNDYFLLWAIFLIFLSGSASKKQLGLRYILPIYPFIFVLVSQTVNWWSKNRLRLSVLVLLIFFYVSANLKIYPHYLSYFNEIAGGPDNGWKYLVDSNIDWGQDLKGLKKYIDENGVSDVILSYYGITDPHYYGIVYQDLVVSMMFNRTGTINSLFPRKEILAVSVNNLQSLYFYDKHLFEWLKKRKPTSKIGYSIFVYDITDDTHINEYLAQIYYNSGWTQEAYRQCQRLLILQKDNPVALFTLALLAMDDSQPQKALDYFDRFKKTKTQDFLPANLSLINYGSYNLKASREAKMGYYYVSFFKLADVCFRSGKYDDASILYTMAAKINPASESAYFNLGLVYLRQNNKELAAKNFEEVLRLNPHHLDARKYLTAARGNF